ncbi:hypothetical protein ACHEXK_05980 [Limnohabitans sp. DCL3]|uniref:hypothetical protein n=1 Tax=Limnohabitans sp. DCL3 TaxID=3374103 RepID=UPI003A8BEB4E
MRAKQDQHFSLVLFGINTHMQIHEVVTKPKTPEQLRLDSLQANKDRAADALTAERQRQKLSKAQKAVTAARHPPRDTTIVP